MRLASLLRDLEAEPCVRADLASSGRRLREDDASRAAYGGNGGNTCHYEACLLEAATDFRNGLADQFWAQVCFRRFPDRNQNVYGGAPYLPAFRWRILCHNLIGFGLGPMNSHDIAQREVALNSRNPCGANAGPQKVGDDDLGGAQAHQDMHVLADLDAGSWGRHLGHYRLGRVLGVEELIFNFHFKT